MSLIIEARNRASAALRSVTKDMGAMTSVGSNLQGTLQLIQSSIVGLTLLAPVLAASLAGIAISDSVQRIVEYERGLRRARIQLQLMGFTVEEASDRLERLNRIMGTDSHRALVANASALRNVALAGDNLVEQIHPLALGLSELIDVDVADAMDAIVTAITQLDPTKFIQLVGAVEGLNLDRDHGILKALEVGDVEPFMRMLTDFIRDEQLSSRELLMKNAKELLNLVMPAQDAISEAAATFANVLVTSIIRAIENSRQGYELAVGAALGSIQWSKIPISEEQVAVHANRTSGSWWTAFRTSLLSTDAIGRMNTTTTRWWEQFQSSASRSAGLINSARGLAGRFMDSFRERLAGANMDPDPATLRNVNWGNVARLASGALAAAMVGFLLPTLVENIPEVLSNAELITAAGVGAAVLGRRIGFNLSTTLIATALIAFGPGLVQMFERLGTDEKVMYAAGALGFIISRVMGQGILNSLGIGTIIVKSINDVRNDDGAKLAMGTLGSIIGFAVGGRFGRVFSALLGAEIGRGAREQFRGKASDEVFAELDAFLMKLGGELNSIIKFILDSINYLVSGSILTASSYIEAAIEDLKNNVVGIFSNIGQLIGDIFSLIRSNPLEAARGGVADLVSSFVKDNSNWNKTSSTSPADIFNMDPLTALQMQSSGTIIQQLFAHSYMSLNPQTVGPPEASQGFQDTGSMFDPILQRLYDSLDAASADRDRNLDALYSQYGGGRDYGYGGDEEGGYSPRGQVRGGFRYPGPVEDYDESMVEGEAGLYSPLIVEFRMDRKIIERIAVEGVYKVAKGRAGMFKGSIE